MSASVFQSLACVDIACYCSTKDLHPILRVSSVHRQALRHCVVKRCLEYLAGLGQVEGGVYLGRNALAAIETLGDIAEKGNECAILALSGHLEKLLDVTTPMFLNIEAVSEALAKLVDSGRPELVVAVSSRLNHSNAVIREHAVHALGALAENCDRHVITSLIARMQDDEFAVAFAAETWLIKVAGEGDDHTISALLALLRHDCASVVCHALRVLGQIAKKDDRTIATLAGLLEESDVGSSREHKSSGIDEGCDSDCNSSPDEGCDSDCNSSPWQHEGVQEEAVCAIGNIALQGDRIAMRIVCARLEDELPGPRAEAVVALSKLAERGSQESLGAVLACLHDEESEVRQVALGALHDLSEKGDHHVIAAVKGCLEDEFSDVREAALDAIQDLSEKGDQNVISAVEACLADHEERVRFSAIEALLKLADVGSKSFIVALRECLKDAKEFLFEARKIDDDPDIIGAVSACLDDEDQDVRKGAVIMLGHLGEKTPCIQISLQTSYAGHRPPQE